MNTDTPATASDLDKALSRIGHDDPTWVIPDKIFKRKGNAKEFRIRPDDEAQLTEEAEQTGWRRCTPAWDWKAESWQTHIALQQLGVGVGHPMYLRMMSRYHTGRLVDLSKKDFAAGHNLAHLPQAARDATQFKDLVSMSMKHDIVVEHYTRHGDQQMKDREQREKREVTEWYELKEGEEEEARAADRAHSVRPKRTLPPGMEKAKRAKTHHQSEPAETTAAASGSGPPSGRTKEGRAKLTIPLLESLIQELRARGLQYCDTKQMILFAWEGPAAFSPGNEPDAEDENSTDIERQVDGEHGKNMAGVENSAAVELAVVGGKSAAAKNNVGDKS